MKNLSLILNVVLFVAVGVLYYLHFASNPSSSSGSLTTGPSGDLQIAFINADSILQKYEYLEVKKKQLEERLSNQLKEAQEKVTKTWQMYENSTIERALLDAAIANEAYNPDQVATLLRRSAKLIEKKDEHGKLIGGHEVMVELADQHAETDEPIVTTRTPDAAVKRMKELQKHGNLFKSGVVSGLGSHSAAGGVTPGKNGRLSREQIANLSQDQYNKIRKENPALLGFSK